ncbi:recombinase family protein [Rhizobiaceae bacterium n13]|uniref:Recombinase family protein n=1 Tax=Ferirhizobium litorale TaxID=2927786 RepID=A0AAE3QJ38_9HYPH|nr:recombinase family protein [Fererhizobium litorale]MDI7864589.1 recombinase family protein [Fererhizobium litorale]MDI7924870.1 recombinase family protein [Fererhizobium litorale]
MTKNVLFYARSSTTLQLGTCFETQLNYAKRFIRENGWSLEAVCRDEDIGEVVFTAQPGARKLLGYIEEEAIDVVLCHTLDRLCSRYAVAERLLHDLHAKGIEVWAADPGVRIKTNELTEHYSNDQSGVFGLGNPVAPMPDELYEAEQLAPLPYGYRYTGAINADRQYIFGFRKVDADAANAIQQIFQLYAEGMSPAKIAALLNTLGIAGPHGKPWRDTTIRGDRRQRDGILNDELYLGRSWVPGRDYFDFVPALQIVTQDLWHRVKQRQQMAARGVAK